MRAEFKLATVSSAFVAALVLTAGIAAAAGTPERVRGTIASLVGQKMVVHGKHGKDVTVMLDANLGVAGVIKASLADIKPGVFIGTATTDAGSELQSVEVVVFPPAMKGVGEGHYPWDLPGASKMTNATVATDVKGVDGQTVTVKYKGGEKKIKIPANVPIVTLVPGSAADLHVGESVFVPGLRQADGTVQASRILYGKDGVTPPM
jgi:hypothetical protein